MPRARRVVWEPVEEQEMQRRLRQMQGADPARHTRQTFMHPQESMRASWQPLWQRLAQRAKQREATSACQQRRSSAECRASARESRSAAADGECARDHLQACAVRWLPRCCSVQ